MCIQFSGGPWWWSPNMLEVAPPWMQVGLLMFFDSIGEGLLSQAPSLALPTEQLGVVGLLL